jgi:hypothetical protein
MEFLLVLAMYSCWVSLTSAIPLQGRLTSHWEWRDGESSVYPRARIRPGSRSTVLSGGDGHVLVLGYPGKS